MRLFKHVVMKDMHFNAIQSSHFADKLLIGELPQCFELHWDKCEFT